MKRFLGRRPVLVSLALAVTLRPAMVQSSALAAARSTANTSSTRASGSTKTTVDGVQAIVDSGWRSSLTGGRAVNAIATVNMSQVTSAGEKCVSSGGVKDGICARTGIVGFTITGDIGGSTVWAASSFFVPTTGSVGFSGTLVVENATVKGCGTGTVAIAFGPSPIGTKSPNGKQDYPGLWRIAETSKSSPLAKLQGEGLVWADSYGPGPFVSHLSGVVKC